MMSIPAAVTDTKKLLEQLFAMAEAAGEAQQNAAEKKLAGIQKVFASALMQVLANPEATTSDRSMPMIVEICEHLASTFMDVMDYDDGTIKNVMIARALHESIETVILISVDNKEVTAELEKTVLRVVRHIFRQAVPTYFVEALYLLDKLSSSRVSEDMWKQMEFLYQVFDKDKCYYFVFMMPVLYHYVTVDTNAFLSNEKHVITIFNMCKKVINTDDNTSADIHAAKLLEVMVLQCKGRIDQYLPSFVELALSILARKFKTNKLRTMMLQVIIAILYCNPVLTFKIIGHLQESVPNTSIAKNFIKQWIDDIDCFVGIHDRKICVLGICTLLEMGPARPPVLDQVVGQIVPSCLILFQGLKRAYEVRAKASPLAVDDEGGGEEEGEGEVLSDDEDENLTRDDGSGDQFYQAVKANLYDSSENFEDMTYIQMEDFNTSIDKCDVNEYEFFKNVLTGLAATTEEPAFYHALTDTLTWSQRKDLQEVFLMAGADKRDGLFKGPWAWMWRLFYIISLLFIIRLLCRLNINGYIL